MPNAIVRYRSTQLRSLAPPDELAFLEDFLVDMRQRSIAEATIRSYRHDCSELYRSVCGIPLSAIRPRDVRHYLGLLFDRGASDQTLRRTLCALRTLFRFAEVVDAVQVSPARAVQTRRVKRRLPNVLTEAEIERLIEAGATLRDRAVLEFFYSTGCRIAEVAGARVEDVDLNTRSARVIGKGDKQRIVLISRRAVDLLKAYLGNRTSGWLFQAEGRPDQRGRVARSLATGYWLGLWRTEYHIENGRLKFRTKAVRLGNMNEISRAEARHRLDALLAGKLAPRERPISRAPLSSRAIRAIVYSAAARAGLLITMVPTSMSCSSRRRRLKKATSRMNGVKNETVTQ